MDEAKLQQELNKTVLHLFQKKNSTFLSTLYCGMKFQWDDSIPTACTNGLILKWNPQWFLSLAPQDRVFVLAHECWHVAYDHMGRREDRDPRIWNAAADHAINLDLKANGYLISTDHLADPRFRGMSAEQIYNILIQEKDPSDPSELPFGEDFEPAETVEERQQVQAGLVRAVTAARMNNEAGDLPGEITQLIDKLLNPKLPWHQVLRRFLTDISSTERTWRKPNRRYQDMYLPSDGGDEGLMHLMYAMDVSGSMTDGQLQVLNTELSWIQKSLNPERMTVVSFDTEVQDTWEFVRDQTFEQLEIHGRGGTCLEDLWRLVKEQRSTALVVFSDLECSIPPNPGIPVIWVCMDNKRRHVPYGRIIHVDSREYSGT